MLLSRALLGSSFAAALILFTGCGGGGGDSPSQGSSSGPTFPVRAAYQAVIAAGSVENFNVSGSCTGTATLTAAPAIAATFEGVTGLSAAQSIAARLSGCTPATVGVSGTAYYDSTSLPIGASLNGTGGTVYEKFSVAPVPLPATLRIGDSGDYSTQNKYSDSTKAVLTGKLVSSYVIEADSAADTAIANLITRDYDTSNALILTQQTRYRITSAGTATLLSIDQSRTSDSLHLVWTRVSSGVSGASYTTLPGASTSPVNSTFNFPLQTGYRSRQIAGASDNFTISGTCMGTARIASSPVTPTTFEGVSGFQSSQTSSVTFSNCVPATSTATGTNFVNSTYTPIGTVVTGLEYSKFAAAPVPLPASVKVGDTAAIVSLTTYTDSTKATVTGRRDLSYAIEADTTNTAIVNIVTRTYDSTNTLLLTQQNRYRIAVDGSLTPISIDMQYGAPSNAHLVYTRAS